jgi:hypothetical protein
MAVNPSPLGRGSPATALSPAVVGPVRGSFLGSMPMVVQISIPSTIFRINPDTSETTRKTTIQFVVK